ncbi:TPA: hypothetical protein SMF89_004579 [Serratia marcescens]|nr:hypothetical protein [Serratia marcescens]
MKEDIEFKIDVDCSTTQSTANEIIALKGLLATMFVCLDQSMKEAVIYQLSQRNDIYSQRNLDMLRQLQHIHNRPS